MANPHRGEVELAGDGKTYVIRFSVNSLCELEEQIGEPVVAIAEKLKDPKQFRMSTARALLWAGLLDRNPEITIEQAGEIAAEVGLPACMAAIGKAFSLAFPAAKEKTQQRPPRAATS